MNSTHNNLSIQPSNTFSLSEFYTTTYPFNLRKYIFSQGITHASTYPFNLPIPSFSVNYARNNLSIQPSNTFSLSEFRIQQPIHSTFENTFSLDEFRIQQPIHSTFENTFSLDEFRIQQPIHSTFEYPLSWRFPHSTFEYCLSRCFPHSTTYRITVRTLWWPFILMTAGA